MFDLINHIAGYTHKYYEETIEKIDHDGLVAKYREENKKFESKPNDSPLLADKYPHALLVLESI
jgi:hypothetical protein